MPYAIVVASYATILVCVGPSISIYRRMHHPLSDEYGLSEVGGCYQSVGTDINLFSIKLCSSHSFTRKKQKLSEYV